ncbi:MAG: aldehyde dehydrogenase family protein [Fimbriimonadaceae bacterium]|nr:aldehyde dehydrogenase family protein [Fimbriimonadaceae bacterium]
MREPSIQGFNETMLHLEMLIDGHFIGGPCDQAVGKEIVKNPYDQSIVGTVAEGGWNEANAAISAAQEAFLTWRKSSASERSKLLGLIAMEIRERGEELAHLLVAEIGKPITWARGEVSRLAITFDLASVEALNWEPETLDFGFDSRGKDYSGSFFRFPVGPVLCIVPYNWPFNLTAHKLAPALATGNTIILKPSGLAPISTMTLARIIHECGCPPGVLNCVNVPAPVAEKMALNPRVKVVNFTGSPKVGWHLKQICWEKKVLLELGGNASVIVMPDADLQWAASRTAVSAYGYAGQVCISAQHCWVHASVYDEFKHRLIEATQACPTGDPAQEETVCGPLMNSESVDRVISWIDEAESAGADILVRGAREGNVLGPTLIENVPSSVPLGCEEVFGPVLTLAPFDEISEAIAKVNASQYGIHASLFTHDQSVIDQVYAELEVGGLIVNDFPSLRFDNMPYGGVKRSGFGREGVRFAMEEMTEPKMIVNKS